MRGKASFITIASLLLAYHCARPAIGANMWNVDFQGDGDHRGLFYQTDPIDHTEEGVVWNIFEVQAFNSKTKNKCILNPSMVLLDNTGADHGVSLSFIGNVVGWSGKKAGDSLLDDYLILRSGAGIDTSSVAWTIDGLKPMTEYDLTFYAHNGGSPVRGIRFSVAGQVAFTQTTAEPPVTVRISTGQTGSILGTAVNALEPKAEGDWAALQIQLVGKDEESKPAEMRTRKYRFFPRFHGMVGRWIRCRLQ